VAMGYKASRATARTTARGGGQRERGTGTGRRKSRTGCDGPKQCGSVLRLSTLGLSRASNNASISPSFPALSSSLSMSSSRAPIPSDCAGLWNGIRRATRGRKQDLRLTLATVDHRSPTLALPPEGLLPTPPPALLWLLLTVANDPKACVAAAQHLLLLARLRILCKYVL